MVMKYGGKWMDNTQLSVHVQKNPPVVQTSVRSCP